MLILAGCADVFVADYCVSVVCLLFVLIMFAVCFGLNAWGLVVLDVCCL